ncbi:MAG TPA: protein kinase [Kofleriaceae bacterium]|nr:protein kinase [Kofleriaceae bacterium]
MTDGPSDPTLLSGSGGAELHAEEAYCSACGQSFASDVAFCPNDGARLIKLAAERDELIGRVLDARYEIRSPLGKGGMGTVYRGWQLSVDREVAIKVIHPKLAGDRSTVKRFLREARLASRLSQPNIVNVYDFGQSEGVLYLVMELLRGHTLASELGQARRINPRRTITIASQLCDALEAAHAQGIVHRDLKPSNIVILDDPPGRDLIKVLDFGLAKSLVQDSGSVVTNTDALLGTPLYMAPEQIEGAVSDQRADLYSLGCILYEMLSGKPPFLDNAVSVVLARHMHDHHEELPVHIPAKLRSLIDKLLAKRADERLQSAGEVHRVLQEVRDSAPALGTGPTPLVVEIPNVADTVPDVPPALAATHAAMPPPPVRAGTQPPESLVQPAPSRARSRRFVLIAIIAALPLAVLAFVMVRSPGGMPERAAAPSRSDAVDAAVHEAIAPPPVDAAIDATAIAVEPPGDAAVPIDAPAKVRTKRHDRPRARPDAGGQLPDIDFLDVGKKK